MYYEFLLFVICTCAVHIAAQIKTIEGPAGCTQYDCKYLYDHIVNYVNQSKDVCQDIYSFTCNSTDHEEGIFSEQSMHTQYVKLIERVEFELNDDSYMAEFEPIKKEREFYKQCMRYGDEQALRTRSHLQFLAAMYNISITYLSEKWEILDRHLYRGGFGYAFFNIRVISDPRNRYQNIILLEPPTFDYFTEIYETLKMVKLFSEKYKKPKTDIEFLLHDYVNSDKPKYVQELVQSVAQAIFKSTNHFVDNGSKVTTINAWRSDFNKKYVRSNVTDIDWLQLLTEAFYEVGIQIDGNTSLLVKNEMYFSKLFDILFETPNEVIAVSVVVKAIAENLKYIDWNLATKIKVISSRHRSEFCLHSTKLYGISYAILKGYNKHPNSKLHRVTNKIISALAYEIEKTPSLSDDKKSYLKSELDTITAYVEKSDAYFAQMVENFYEGVYYDVRESYLDNILYLRKIMKQRELAMLKPQPGQSKAYLPFSIIDLARPANRFAINVYFASLKFNHNLVKREIIYGRYGVQIASVLYALLNENKLEDYPLPRYTTLPSKNHLNAHPDYSLNKMQCVIPGVHRHNKKQYLEAMSNVYGLRIAHKTLEPSVNDVPLFPEIGLYHIRQFFHLEYVKEHCYMEKDTINSIALSDESFHTAFPECSNSSVKCTWTAFDHLSKNIFFI